MGRQVAEQRLLRAGVCAAAILMLAACGSSGGAGSPPSAASAAAADDVGATDDEARAVASTPATSTVVSSSTSPATTAATTAMATTTTATTTVATTAPVAGSAVVTLVDIGPARAAVEGGATIGRQWTESALLAWPIDPDGDPDAPVRHRDEYPAGTAVVGDQLPAALAGAAFDLATAAGRPPVGLGTDELLAVAGLVGEPAGVEPCGTEPSNAVVCATQIGAVAMGRIVGYEVYDRGTDAGSVDVVYDATGAWRIATWGGPPATPATVTTPATTTATGRATITCGMPNEPPHHFPIQRGDSGADVSAVQELLILNGFDVGASGADGHFGPATEAALRAYHSSGMTVEQTGARAGAACMEDYYVLIQLTESDIDEPH